MIYLRFISAFAAAEESGFPTRSSFTTPYSWRLGWLLRSSERSSAQWQVTFRSPCSEMGGTSFLTAPSNRPETPAQICEPDRPSCVHEALLQPEEPL